MSSIECHFLTNRATGTRLEATERSFQVVLKTDIVFIIIFVQSSFKEGDMWTKTFALGSIGYFFQS